MTCSHFVTFLVFQALTELALADSDLNLWEMVSEQCNSHLLLVMNKTSFNITIIQVYIQTSNVEKVEVERFYKDLQEFLELIPKKDVLFIIGDWNAKVGSQELPEVTWPWSTE